MPLSYLPSGRPGLVPRTRGFGARLLGMDPELARTDTASAILAARQERDLLRGDLLLLCADGTLLPDIVGRVDEPEAWDDVELGEPGRHTALAAALGAVAALCGEGPTGVLLTGPLALAAHATRAGSADPLDEDAVDACGLIVRDAAEAVLDAGGHVVLEERRAPARAELALCAPLLNLLAHRRSPALVLVHDADAGALADDLPGIGATVAAEALPSWGAAWSADAPVLAPEIPADASPERVQALLRDLRAGAVA